MAIRFRSARNTRRFESDFRLRAPSLGGVIIVHHVRDLRIASKKIRHGRNSRFVHRNGVARAAGYRLSHFFKDERSLNFWTAAHFIVDLVNERGDCHGGAAGLVRHAAQHLRLTTLGFLQYLAPTGTFFLGVFVYHEPFTRNHLITFAMIWIALVIFTGDAVMHCAPGGHAKQQHRSWDQLRYDVIGRKICANVLIFSVGEAVGFPQDDSHVVETVSPCLRL